MYVAVLKLRAQMVNLLTCVYVLRSIQVLHLLFISQPKLGGHTVTHFSLK